MRVCTVPPGYAVVETHFLLRGAIGAAVIFSWDLRGFRSICIPRLCVPLATHQSPNLPAVLATCEGM